MTEPRFGYRLGKWVEFCIDGVDRVGQRSRGKPI